MPLYARRQVIDQLKREFHYAFAEIKYPGVPEVIPFEISNHVFEVEGLQITPIEGLHHKLPVFGFRIKDFSYITDMNFISDVEIEKLKGSKVLVVNALQKTEHLSHFTLQEALELIEKVNPETAYLTHLSHKMGKHALVSKELPSNVKIAVDSQQLFL